MTRSTPRADTPPAATRGGLATIGPAALALRTALEQRFTGWAAEVAATPMLYPPLMRVADLHKIDYFRNFPHLAILGSELAADAVPRYTEPVEHTDSIPVGDLTEATYTLPSAACYNIYFDLAGQTLDSDAHRVTTVATCFRRETHYDGLRRLLGFTMREIVCVGDREVVLEHLRSFKRKLTDYFTGIGLPVEVQAATDPFYESGGSRALMAQLFPVKEEFVFGGSLAIGSVNFHRNFFGERCDIRTPDGQPAFSGCVAFGVERWISALTTHFGVGPEELVDRVLAD